MKYRKNIDTALDLAYKKSAKYGMNVKFANEAIFYRRGLHWKYVNRNAIERIYRRVEEVITHTSCCAENMDIEKLIITDKSGNIITIHVCDGEKRLAEGLYADIQAAWPEISYGKPEKAIMN